MPVTTGKQLPYPAASDPVASGSDNMRKLAQSVDNMVQYGNVSIDLAADTNNSVAVTFPVAYDAAAGNPTVVAGAGSVPGTGTASTHTVWVTGRSPTGFNAGAKRTVQLAGFQIQWVSVGKVATVT